MCKCIRNKMVVNIEDIAHSPSYYVDSTCEFHGLAFDSCT